MSVWRRAVVRGRPSNAAPPRVQEPLDPSRRPAARPGSGSRARRSTAEHAVPVRKGAIQRSASASPCRMFSASKMPTRQEIGRSLVLRPGPGRDPSSWRRRRRWTCPPRSCRASSSRTRHVSRMFRKVRIAAGLSRSRSAGSERSMTAPGGTAWPGRREPRTSPLLHSRKQTFENTEKVQLLYGHGPPVPRSPGRRSAGCRAGPSTSARNAGAGGPDLLGQRGGSGRPARPRPRTTAASRPGSPSPRRRAARGRGPGRRPRRRGPASGRTNMPRTLVAWSARPSQPRMRMLVRPHGLSPGRTADRSPVAKRISG